MFSRIIDDKLYLRILDSRHVEDLFKLTESNRERLRRWLPWLDVTTTDAHVAQFIQTSFESFKERKNLVCGVFDDSQLAGVVSFNSFNWTQRSASIGYWVGSAFSRKGLMTKSVYSLMAHGFDELDLNRIEISAATRNAESRGIPERLGMTLEGTLREVEWLYDHFEDHAVYSMLKSEFNVRKKLL